MKKHNPPLTPARSWASIEKGYADLIEHGLKLEPMLALVQHIQSTQLSERLYAYTSMHKLVIGIYPEIEWNREALHIEFDINTRKWYFRYYAKPFEPIEMERSYNENAGIEKLDQFIRFIRW
jgi:hypothetical protein